MARKIVICDCSECPHHDHKGAFGIVAYIPVCRETNLTHNELPYVKDVSSGGITAIGTDVIPNWCPLEEDK